MLRIGLIQIQLRVERLSQDRLSDAELRRLLAQPERYWAESRQRVLRYMSAIPRGL